MSLTEIPIEILCLICDDLDEPKSYHSFSLINKKCSLVAKLLSKKKKIAFIRKIEKIYNSYKKIYYQYPSGTMHGEFLIYQDEQLIYKTHYENGFRHGKTFEYNLYDGTIEMKKTYNKNQTHGNMFLYENGELLIKTYFQKGIELGPRIIYSNGNFQSMKSVDNFIKLK